MSENMIKSIQIAIVLVFFGFLLYSSIHQMGLETDSRSEIVTKESSIRPKDYDQLTEKELLVLAYDGDSKAAYHLGLMYDYGLMDTSQSFERAKQWYESADIAGVSDAACALGYIYLNGCGVDRDLSLAAEYFQRAIAEGNDDGHIGLGRIALYQRSSAKKNKRKALERKAYEEFKKAADSGSPEGIYFLGYVTEKGIGTRIDPGQAVAYYNKVLELVSDDLSDRYAKNNADTRLGILYMDGRGVDQNMELARTHFEAAANRGYAMAQYYMGIVYDMGYGIREDYDEALRWFELAAQQDYAPALNQIGYMYFMGKGVNVDYSQAVYYQKLAAALGYAKAQVNLGYLYENGYGVERNYETALSYYKMASEADYKGAKEAVIRVENLMSKAQKKK